MTRDLTAASLDVDVGSAGRAARTGANLPGTSFLRPGSPEGNLDGDLERAGRAVTLFQPHGELEGGIDELEEGLAGEIELDKARGDAEIIT